MRRILPSLLPALALLIAGCGSSSSSSSSAAPAAAAAPASSSPAGGGATSVTMKNLAFAPATVTVKVGGKVTWTNGDSPPHNVVPQGSPAFAASPSVMNPGQTYSVTFTKPGTYSYICSIHPFMKGKVVVSG